MFPYWVLRGSYIGMFLMAILALKAFGGSGNFREVRCVLCWFGGPKLSSKPTSQQRKGLLLARQPPGVAADAGPVAHGWRLGCSLPSLRLMDTFKWRPKYRKVITLNPKPYSTLNPEPTVPIAILITLPSDHSLGPCWIIHPMSWL